MKRLGAVILLLLLTGCAARTEAPAAVTEAPSPVYTDWSKLTPYEPTEEICTYHAGYRTDGHFEPRGDYGALLPYIGKYSAMEQYVIDALPFYGIVTDRGELVSEPVYTWVRFYDGFMMLYRGDLAGVSGGDGYSGGRFAQTIAASDGRWAEELEDGYYVASGNGMLMTASGDGSLDLWNEDGRVVTHFDGAVFRERFGEDFDWGREGGPFVNWTDGALGYVTAYLVRGEYLLEPERLYLDLENGAVLTEPPAGYPEEIDYSLLGGDDPVPPEIGDCLYAEPHTDPVTGEVCFYCFLAGKDGAPGHYALFDSAGRHLLDHVDLWRFETSLIVRAGLCSTIEDGCFCYRSLSDGSLVFRRIMRTNTD